MGLTYFGGEALLNYLYNDNDTLGDYDSFLIELTKSDGTSYTGGGQNEGLTRTSSVWGITDTFVYNNNDITFPPKTTSGTETLTSFNLYIDGIGQDPELFATGTLNNFVIVQEGETPIIRAYDSQEGDGITIYTDISGKYTDAFERKINEYIFFGQDSLSSVNQYRFILINTQGAQTPLEFYLARDSSLPNWTLPQIGSGSNSYAQAQNTSDIVLGLNNTNTNISTNLLRMFYGEGTFPNETYTSAGGFFITATNGTSQITTTIANGETARLQTGQLRINAK